MKNLRGKKVLLIAAKLFNYENEIKNELEKLGAKVTFYDQRPSNDFFTKVLIRFNFKLLIGKKINHYYKQIIETNANINYDYIFLVSPESIGKNNLLKLKKTQPNSNVIIYMWDSIKNKKQALELLPYADKFFTFDSNDKSINQKIEFLPLFYIRDYENISDDKDTLTYDVAFIGTVHSDRYKIIKQVEEQLKHHNLKTFSYFYSPSKILFFFQKLFKKDFRTIQWSDVSFESLNKKDVVEIIKQSKAIVDIQHPLQSGLTMRTIEILGAKRKLLTTNQNIKDYDFFNENNIYIINRNHINLNINFFIKPYKELNKNLYKKYSITEWLYSIFNSPNIST